MSGRLLTMADLQSRWAAADDEVLSLKSTKRIISRLGLRPIRLGHRTVRYRPEDVDDCERAAQMRPAAERKPSPASDGRE